MPFPKVEDFLVTNAADQSPGPTRIVSAFRTNDGRPVNILSLSIFILRSSILNLQVTAGIEDSTYMGKDGSEDAHWRADLHSGKRGHGNCLLVAHQVDLKGKFIAIRPPSISTTPRGSDTSIMALQVFSKVNLKVCDDTFLDCRG